MKRILIGLIAAYSSLLLVASEGNDGESRSATVSLDVTSSDLINIQAKYTELTIEAWDKNEVMIEASVVFDAKMNKRVQDFLDNFEEEVKSNISKKGGEVVINTNLDEPNKVQIGSKNIGIIFEFSEDELRVEYKIKAPSKNKYIIYASYKDTQLVGDFDEMEITQYSGDLTAEFIGKAKLNLKYGSAIFKGIEYANIEMYEQEFESGKIQDLKLDAKYSDLEITEIGSLEAKSYESDYVIGSIGNLSGNFKYGEMEVTQEIGSARITLYEEDIEARKINKLILENSKYSKIQIGRLDVAELIESYEDEFTIGVLSSLINKSSKYGKYVVDQLQGEFLLNGYEDKIDIDYVSSSASEIEINGKYLVINLGMEEVAFQLKSKIKYGDLDYNEDKIDIRKYIKESDEIEVELLSKKQSNQQVLIRINGYEIDLNIE